MSSLSSFDSINSNLVHETTPVKNKYQDSTCDLQFHFCVNVLIFISYLLDPMIYVLLTIFTPVVAFAYSET